MVSTILSLGSLVPWRLGGSWASPAALPQLEFAAQGGFPWWAVVAAVAGAALLVYAVLLYHQTTAAAHDKPADLGRGLGFEALSAPVKPVRLFGLSVAAIAALLGAGSLALTLLLVVFGAGAELATLAWTGFLTVAAVGLFYLRVYRSLSRPRLITLFALRTLGVLFLLLLLFGPVLAFTIAPENRSKLAVVIDASGSMGVNDQANEPNRYRQAVLAVETKLAPALGEQYDLQVFAYDGKHSQPLPRIDDLDGIPPNGQVTDLAAAMTLGTSAGATQVVLFSDGIHNAPLALSASLPKIAVPVHTVSVGSSVTEPSTVPDIAVVEVDGPQTATVNNQLTLTASIKSTALSDRTVRVQLMHGTTQMDEQRLVLRSGPTPQTVQLKFTPDKVGRAVVRVQVPVDPSERNDANNALDYAFLVTDPKLAVLYVEGRVRPEVGPLRRALEQDPNVNAISMVQTQAGKFELRGVKDGDDIRGMPTTLAQWKRFKVIILGDLDATFLNAQQQRDLQQAVKEGAGLLMIGGQNSFAPGGWDKTVLADLLPVSLAKTDPAQINASFVPKLTAAGLNSPIFRNLAAYFISPDNKAPATQMPALSGCVTLASAKASANVLAVHPGVQINGQPAIVLATGQYAQGRTAAFAADTTWRWSLFLKGMGKDSPYNRFWGQLVRWLAAQEDLAKKSGPSVTAMVPKDRYEAGEPVVLRCAVTDLEGQATKFAQVSAELKAPDGRTAALPMAALEDQIGIYEATYQPQLAGQYAVTFRAQKEKKNLGADKSSFTVVQVAGEMEVLAANPAAMEDIAKTTGGAHASLAAIDDLIHRLAQRAGPAGTAVKTSYGLFNSGLPLGSGRRFTLADGCFLAFILALTLEWFLRRKWQLQ